GWPKRSEGRVRGSLARASIPSPAGLTRGSIFFARRWIAGSSPAMTTEIAARVRPSPGSRLPCPSPGPRLQRSPPSPRSAGRGLRPRLALRSASSRASAGDRVSLPRALIPLQRSGVGGLARGEFLWRKIVDRDSGGDGVRRGAKGLRLGGVDQPLRQRGIDVAHARVAQAVAQRRRVDDGVEGAPEPRGGPPPPAVEEGDPQGVA